MLRIRGAVGAGKSRPHLAPVVAMVGDLGRLP